MGRSANVIRAQIAAAWDAGDQERVIELTRDLFDVPLRQRGEGWRTSAVTGTARLAEHGSRSAARSTARQKAPKRTPVVPIRRVLVTRYALGRMRAQGLADGVERGGGLWGEQRDDTLVVLDASDNGYPGQRGRPHSVSISLDHLERLDGKHRARTGLRRLGDYHSHPSTFDPLGAKASDQDLRSWRGNLDARLRHGDDAGFRFHLGLVLTPSAPLKEWQFESEQRWRKPIIVAHLLGRDRAGKATIDLLQVDIQPAWAVGEKASDVRAFL